MILVYTKTTEKMTTSFVADFFTWAQRRIGGPETVNFSFFFAFFLLKQDYFFFNQDENHSEKKHISFFFQKNTSTYSLRLSYSF